MRKKMSEAKRFMMDLMAFVAIATTIAFMFAGCGSGSDSATTVEAKSIDLGDYLLSTAAIQNKNHDMLSIDLATNAITFALYNIGSVVEVKVGNTSSYTSYGTTYGATLNDNNVTKDINGTVSETYNRFANVGDYVSDNCFIDSDKTNFISGNALATDTIVINCGFLINTYQRGIGYLGYEYTTNGTLSVYQVANVF